MKGGFLNHDHDRLRYYEALGVSPEIDHEALRAAYRARMKEFHPDRNKAPEASARFQEVQQAYEVLGDPEVRARYDAWTRQPVTTPPPEEFFPVLTCEQCGLKTPHLRVVLIHWVWSALLFTRHGHTPKLLCPSCAHNQLAVASVKAGVLGWWGVPFGPLLTPVTLWKNLVAIQMPREVNVQALLHQTVAFAQRGEIDAAQASLSHADRLVGSDQNLWKKVKEVRAHLPVDVREAEKQDPWRVTMPSLLLRGAAMVPAVVVLTGVWSLVSRDVSATTAREESCSVQRAAITAERAALDQQQSLLSTENDSLRRQRDLIESSRYTADPVFLNSMIDDYNFDLSQFNSKASRLDSQQFTFNQKVDAYNRECAR